MKRYLLSALVVGAYIVGGSSNAFAAQEMYKKGNMYINLGAGIFELEDIGASLVSAGSVFGITYSAAATTTYTFDTGYQVHGGIGYNITDNLSYELDLSYSGADYNTVTSSATVVATALGSSLTLSGSQTLNVEGNVSGLAAMNSLVANFGNDKFNPYLGAGLGLVYFQDEINSIGALSVNGKRSGTAPGAALLVGVDAQLSGGALGLRYKYLWAATGENGYDDAIAHAITLNYKLPF